jgi:FkbM family methyltransferase
MSFMKNYGPKFAMFKHIIGKESPVIVEVGSHYGEDTLRFLETFKSPLIYCFEPDPRNIAIFEKYVKNKNVKLHTQALSNFNGKSSFYQSYIELNDNEVPQKYDWITKEEYFSNNLNSSGASSLKKGYNKLLGSKTEVDVLKASQWAKENKIKEIDLLWVDVQGSEKEVILGFEDEIQKVKFLWIEYGEELYEGAMSRSQTIDLLDSLGFTCIENLSNKAYQPQGDLLFINKNHSLVI